jgi:Spy/CpxP family protein refolding chaperone
MKTPQSSIALAAMVLVASCTVAAAATMPSTQPVTATPHWNNGNKVTYFNKQGKQQNTATHFAQVWGDASLGG